MEEDVLYVKSPRDGSVVGTIPRTADPIADAKAASELLHRLGLLDGGRSDKRTAMLEQAHAFATTAIYIERELIQKRNAAGVPTFAVNAAFALEVYLKLLSLQYVGAVNRKEHNLRKLYDALPESARDVIRAEVPASIAVDPQNAEFDLLAIIDDLANGFIHWRYRYETAGKNSLHVHLPGTIYAMRLLNAACKTAIKDPPFGSQPSERK